MTEDTIENDHNNACFSLSSKIWQIFLTLQDKHNICTLSEKINSFALAAKQTRKTCRRLAFLSVSKASTDNLIFQALYLLIPIVV